MANTIPTWSISRLNVYETCPLQAKLKYLDKIPEPPRDADSPAERGIRIHSEAEHYVRNTGPFTPALKKFEHEFNAYRDLYETGVLSLEGDWGIDQNWQQTDYWGPNIWGRFKLDLMHRTSDDTAVVVDYKTGKSFGNEVKHLMQGFCYAIVSFMRFPELNVITVRFMYLDGGTVLERTLTREQAMTRLPNWDQRARIMTSDVTFTPKPNIHNCRFCPYKPDALNICPHGC